MTTLPRRMRPVSTSHIKSRDRLPSANFQRAVSPQRCVRSKSIGVLSTSLTDLEIVQYIKKVKAETKVPQIKRRDSRIGSFTDGGRKRVLSENFYRESNRESVCEDEGTPTVRHTFRFWARFVRNVVSLSHAMKTQSAMLTEKSVMSQIYFYSAKSKNTSEPLIFDAARYSRKQGVRLSDAVLDAVKKDITTRTPADIRQIYKVMNGVRSFKDKFTDSMKRQLCRVATHQRYNEGRVLLRQGQEGHGFYIIHTGSVIVQVHDWDERLEKDVICAEDILKEGDCFGELALMREDGRRTATVITREPCGLFQVDKAHFVKICPDIFERELELKLDIAKDLELFDTWPQEAVESLCFESQLVQVPQGQMIEANWSQAKHIYIVIEGKIQLLRKFNPKSPDRNSEHETTSAFYLRSPLGQNENLKTKFGHVGVLQEGDCNDLRILGEGSMEDIDPLMMVSKSASMLRIPVKLLHRKAPLLHPENFLKNRYIPPEYASDETLRHLNHQKVRWEDYKKRLVKTLVREKEGDYIALISNKKKGYNGWNAWCEIKYGGPDQVRRYKPWEPTPRHQQLKEFNQMSMGFTLNSLEGGVHFS